MFYYVEQCYVYIWVGLTSPFNGGPGGKHHKREGLSHQGVLKHSSWHAYCTLVQVGNDRLLGFSSSFC
jgi:hypothetical protein